MPTYSALGRRRALTMLVALALTIGLLLFLAPGSFAAFQDCGANADATARTNQSNAPRAAQSNTAAQVVQTEAEEEIENDGGDDETPGVGDPNNNNGPVFQAVQPSLSPVTIEIFGPADDVPDDGDGDNDDVLVATPVVVQSNLNESIVAAQQIDQEVDAEQRQVNAVELGPVTQGSSSSPSNGETEGGDCDFRQEQRTGDTGDIKVDASSGDATSGDATGGDSDGDVDVSMATGGDGGGGGANGGSGDYAGAIVNSPNAKSGGGPGGPGGGANCTNCRIVVNNDNRGGDAESGGAESGSVEVNSRSGDSGDNEFNARSEDRTERNDSGPDTDNSGDTGSESGPAIPIGVDIDIEQED